MYRNRFLVGVTVDGQTQEDKFGTVDIPFNSEYSIKLRNKNDRDAIVKLFVDGKEVSTIGDLVVRANSTVDIERYIENARSGRKFKFVPLADGRVKDKGEVENGIIEAKFFLIKKKISPEIVHHYYHDNGYWYYPFYYGAPQWDGGEITFFTTTNNVSTDTVDLMSQSIGCNVQPLSNLKSSDLLNAIAKENKCTKGATVEGGESSQKFDGIDMPEVEEDPTVIVVKLVGHEVDKEEIVDSKYCGNCGRRRKNKENYCANCGNKY